MYRNRIESAVKQAGRGRRGSRRRGTRCWTIPRAAPQTRGETPRRGQRRQRRSGGGWRCGPPTAARGGMGARRRTTTEDALQPRTCCVSPGCMGSLRQRQRQRVLAVSTGPAAAAETAMSAWQVIGSSSELVRDITATAAAAAGTFALLHATPWPSGASGGSRMRCRLRQQRPLGWVGC